MPVKGGFTHRNTTVYRLFKAKVNGEPSFLTFLRIRERIYKKENTSIHITEKIAYIIYKKNEYF